MRILRLTCRIRNKQNSIIKNGTWSCQIESNKTALIISAYLSALRESGSYSFTSYKHYIRLWLIWSWCVTPRRMYACLKPVSRHLELGWKVCTEVGFIGSSACKSLNALCSSNDAAKHSSSAPQSHHQKKRQIGADSQIPHCYEVSKRLV